METIEIKLTDKIMDIRDAIEASGLKNKKELGEDLDYIEDVMGKMLDYIYAEADNLKDFTEDLGE